MGRLVPATGAALTAGLLAAGVVLAQADGEMPSRPPRDVCRIMWSDRDEVRPSVALPLDRELVVEWCRTEPDRPDRHRWLQIRSRFLLRVAGPDGAVTEEVWRDWTTIVVEGIGCQQPLEAPGR